MSDWTQTIGTDLSNDVALPPRPGRSAFHATIRKLHGRLFIRDEGSEGGTWINQLRSTPGRWMEVSFFDTVELGPQRAEGGKPARLSFTPSMYWGVKGAVGLDLETTHLDIRLGNKTLSDGAFARVGRGRICAIMGRAGCGKSIFLEMLAGLRKPDAGRILLTDQRQRIDPYQQGDANYVAFVPQADVLIGDLTVEASMRSRIALIYPGISDVVRQRIVESIGESLGFQGERLKKFLATRIGSPDVRAAVLSGGERRRASVGHEMVFNPMVLLLDEPTSGLSSVDAFEVVNFLKRTAKAYRIPVVLSIHQPANDLFAIFDDILVMAYGGRMLYHGPLEGASAQLRSWVLKGLREGRIESEAATRVEGLDGQSAEFFLKIQENDAVRNYLVECFEQATRSDSKQVYRPTEVAPSAEVTTLDSGGGNPLARMAWGVERFARITWELIDRSLGTLRADRMNLKFTLLQAPMLAVMVCLAFSMGRDKLQRDDNFARTIYWGKQLNQQERGERSLPQLLRDASAMAEKDTRNLGEGHARLEATVMFVLAFSVLWLSTVSAAKEIVQDYGVIAQESRSGVGIVPVVLSRFAVLTALSALQSALLLGVVGVMLLKTFNLGWYVSTWEALILCGALSTAVGLLVSACSTTYRLALTIVPLITIPQVLFSGVLQTVPIVVGTMTKYTLSLLPLRMVWESLLQVSPFWAKGIIILEGQKADDRIGAINIAENLVAARLNGFRELYFGGLDWGHSVESLMLGECCIVLLATIYLLKRRIRHGIK